MMPDCNLARPWNEFDAYLFDIDGTLIHCTDAVHYFAFCDALSSIAGRPVNLDGVTAHGNTDVGILRDAFAHAGVPESEWRPHIEQICQSMCAFVDSRKEELCVSTLPAVEDTLRHLRSKRAIISVATGNLEAIGRLKLSAAGLLSYFHFGAWSDGLENRADVFSRAVVHVSKLAGPDAAILVVGDTPSDVQAARANKLSVVAVATGIHSFDELAAEQPDLCIHSLEELAVCA